MKGKIILTKGNEVKVISGNQVMTYRDVQIDPINGVNHTQEENTVDLIEILLNSDYELNTSQLIQELIR